MWECLKVSMENHYRLLAPINIIPASPHPGNKYFKASGSGIEQLVETLTLIAHRETVLSDREIEVVTHLANGLSLKHIAQALFLSKSSVEKVISNLNRKINVKNTNELISFVVKNNWI